MMRITTLKSDWIGMSAPSWLALLPHVEKFKYLRVLSGESGRNSDRDVHSLTYNHELWVVVKRTRLEIISKNGCTLKGIWDLGLQLQSSLVNL